MLSTKTQCNLSNAEKYFKEHLQLGDYYSQENIVCGEPLCDALERLAVEWIKVRPEKYERLGKGEGTVEDIEIKKSAEQD